MSFPTIPDINPCINIDREDAINLLLVSIALEEFSLADLIDAEVKKICHVVKDDGSEHNTNDIKEINRSVDQTLKDIIKLQMLLQFKLENVQEIICPCSTTTSTSTTTTTTSTTTTTTTTTLTTTTTTTTTMTTTTTTTSTSTTTTTTKTVTTTTTTTTTTKSTTTTTTKTTTKCTTTTTTKSTTTCSTTSTCSTTTARKKCKCCLTGKAKGCVSNKCDYFFGGKAIVRPSVCNGYFDKWKNHLSYCVQKDNVTESIKSLPYCIKICCFKDDLYAIRIKGKCAIVRKTCSQRDICDTGSFELMVWDNFWTRSFQMVITADNKQNLDHDSGKVNFNKNDLFSGE